MSSLLTDSSTTRLFRTLFHQGWLRWWLDGLALCLPDWLKPSSVDDNCLLIDVRGKGASLLARSAGQETVVDTLSLDTDAPMIQSRAKGMPVILQLPKESLFRRQVTLPLAAQENLGEVLKFEMDRLTPFAADQVYYDYRLLARDGGKETLTVEMAVTLKEQLEPWLDYLKASHVQPARATGADLWKGANLLPNALKGRMKSGDSAGLWLLWLLLMVLAGTALLGPLLQKRSGVMALNEQLAEVRKEAQVVLALRDKLDERSLLSDHVYSLRREYLPSVEVLRELTLKLPDDTWLTQFDLRDGRVEIRGESQRSTELISILEDSGLFESVAFRSPVVQSPGTGGERFHLGMMLVEGAVGDE